MLRRAASTLPATPLPMAENNPPPATPPAAPAPAKSGSRTLLIILCVLGGILLLIGGCAVGCTYLVGKKAQEYAKISEKNPAYATLTVLAAIAPDVEVLSKNPDTGLIKLRNKKTGEEVSLDTTQFNERNITEALERFAAGKGVPVKLSQPATTTPAAGPSEETEPSAIITPQRAAALAANLQAFPSLLPPYPGATTREAKTATALGLHTFEYEAVTPDTPAQVLAFYEKKFSAAGLTVAGKSSDTTDTGAALKLSVTSTDPVGALEVEAAAGNNGETLVTVQGSFAGAPK